MMYRVIVRTTSSLQPVSGTYWQHEVLYCGDDRKQALACYHRSEPEDYGSYGNRARETKFQVLDDDSLEPDDPGEFESEDV